MISRVTASSATPIQATKPSHRNEDRRTAAFSGMKTSIAGSIALLAVIATSSASAGEHVCKPSEGSDVSACYDIDAPEQMNASQPFSSAYMACAKGQYVYAYKDFLLGITGGKYAEYAHFHGDDVEYCAHEPCLCPRHVHWSIRNDESANDTIVSTEAYIGYELVSAGVGSSGSISSLRKGVCVVLLCASPDAPEQHVRASLETFLIVSLHDDTVTVLLCIAGTAHDWRSTGKPSG